MKTLRGAAIFLAQYAGNKPPFDNLDTIAAWAAELGFVSVQLPTGPGTFVDLEIAAHSKDYFNAIFAKLAAYDYAGWAMLEWECALKDAQVGAAEGARFIKEHIIPVTAKAFDDFAGGSLSAAAMRTVLGLQ